MSADAAGAELRALAARLLARVTRERLALEIVLADAPSPPARDAPLLRALVSGALRWHHRLQWQAEQLLSRPLKQAEHELAALLRLGLLQLQELRVPDHAAVSATVAAAPLLGAARAKGLVNAVLRRFQRERAALAQRIEAEPDALLSHPSWLLERLAVDWPGRWRRIAAANNALPPMWLRVNLRRNTRREYLARLEQTGMRAEPSRRLGSALRLLEPVSTDALPGFAEGCVSVQDAAAQLAAGFMDLAPGQRVLDACAAPGGKAAHMLEACAELGELWTLDRDERRLPALNGMLTRLGLRATVVHADAADVAGWWDGRPFDRILIDAPCSAVGVIRRHPDVKVLRRAEDVERCVLEQRRLLHSLWPLLGVGGRMLYATCSVLRRENHDQLRDFLADTPEARLVGPHHGRQYQRLPGEANMDGFYYACLTKQDFSHSPRVFERQQ